MQRWFRAYPLLACVWSPLDLAARNAGEWVRYSDLLRPIGVCVATVAVLWIAATLVTRDADKRSFIVFLGVLAFIGVHPVIALVALVAPPPADPVGPTLLLLAAIGLIAVVGTRGSRRSFAPTSMFLGWMTAALVVFALAQLVRAWSGGHETSPTLAVAPVTYSPVAKRPSIYLIVLDAYQGSTTLRSSYGFDNSPFEHALRDRGFVLPLRPRANYTHTRQALSALLNWEYVDGLTSPELYRLVEQNRAMALLKGMGYEVVFFPNNYEPFRNSPQADLLLPDPATIRPELEAVWVKSTLLVPLATVACRVVTCHDPPWLPESPDLTDWKFMQLGGRLASDRPRFVVAHLLVPHEPYVYREDCSHVPLSEVWPDSGSARAAYVGQLSCVNRKVLAAVDAILRTAPTPPVILLQADHGHGPLPLDGLEYEAASPTLVRSRVDVLAAYYLPGAPDTLFYEGITPVNLLPRVFNHLFGTAFPRQADQSFWVEAEAPYRLVPVPADVLAGP